MNNTSKESKPLNSPSTNQSDWPEELGSNEEFDKLVESNEPLTVPVGGDSGVQKETESKSSQSVENVNSEKTKDA